MQKRSHRLLAAALLESNSGFSARRYEAAFLFGSFQPDCNPLSYLKGSRRARFLRGHNYDNSCQYLFSHIDRLQSCRRWSLWHYYTLGKLTHYLADAFTYPHNSTYHDSLAAHRRYEAELRMYLENVLRRHTVAQEERREDLTAALKQLHERYLSRASDLQRDAVYICKANALLLASCLPLIQQVG